MALARPRVGIGLPVCNGEAFLAEALDSLLSQSYGEFTLLVADNASTDRTEEIARDYAARDARVSYHRHPANIGAAPNFNFTFHRVGTEYFRWHAADDLSLPAYTARCVEVLDADPRVALAYCRTTDIDERGEEIGPYEDHLHAPQDLARDRFLHVLTNLQRCNPVFGLMRSSLAARTRLLATFVSSDRCFLAELALYGKLIEVPDRLFRRRYHSGASSAMTDAERVTFNSARPAAPTLLNMQHWKADWLATLRAPLSLGETARLQVDMLRRAYWHKGTFLEESGRVLRHRLGIGRASGTA